MKNKKGTTIVEVVVVAIIVFVFIMIIAGLKNGESEPNYKTEIRNGHRFLVRESYEWGEVHITMTHDPECPCSPKEPRIEN